MTQESDAIVIRVLKKDKAYMELKRAEAAYNLAAMEYDLAKCNMLWLETFGESFPRYKEALEHQLETTITRKFPNNT